MRVRELMIQYRAHPSGAPVDQRSFTDPRSVAGILVPMLGNQTQEIFTLVLLNTKSKLIAVHEVSRGGICFTQVDPKVVFRAALLVNCPRMVLAHNHPSGDPSPSPDDCELTRKLIEGGNILDIEVIDHIIVGDQRYFSFKEMGML